MATVKKCMSCGGSTKKMAKGGTAKKYAMGGSTEIVGMPKYGNNPRTQTGAMVKKGGSITNRPVSPGCRGGQVKDASGKCVNERKFKTGGATNKMAKGGFPDLNKDGKLTKADILKGRGVIKKQGGAIKKK